VRSRFGARAGPAREQRPRRARRARGAPASRGPGPGGGDAARLLSVREFRRRSGVADGSPSRRASPSGLASGPSGPAAARVPCELEQGYKAKRRAARGRGRGRAVRGRARRLGSRSSRVTAKRVGTGHEHCHTKARFSDTICRPRRAAADDAPAWSSWLEICAGRNALHIDTDTHSQREAPAA